MTPASSIPDPRAAGFNWPNARACLQWCANAYKDGPAEWPTVYSATTDAEALAMELDQCIVIAFRGSQDAKDYVQDAKFGTEPFLVRGDVTEVHRGFLEDYESINTRLMQQVNRFKPYKPVFITGHSLGGAQAILAGLDFIMAGYPVAGVYTFGQPRVGNGLFCQVYDASILNHGGLLHDLTWRVVNQNDIVPRVPGVLLGYRHCGNEIFLPTGGGWVLNPSAWRHGLSNALGFLTAWRHRGDVLISEHHIESYQERIQLLA
jgi:hypothetical protein